MARQLTETHLYREIHEQPAVIRRLLAGQRDAVGALARALQERRITHVVIAARGTSDNAARYAQYALGARNGMLVTLATPSLVTVYGRAPRFDHALVLGISQSGASPDIVAVLAEARRQGALTAVITNMTDSDLAQPGRLRHRPDGGRRAGGRRHEDVHRGGGGVGVAQWTAVGGRGRCPRGARRGARRAWRRCCGRPAP